MNPDSWIKGGELVSALQSRQSGGDQFKFFSLSNYSDYKEFWRKIDVLLVPSEADNSPNVIHESKLWGIPVVASNVGGIPELLIPNFDGELLKDGLTLEKVVAELRTSNLLTRNYKTRQQVSKNHKEFLNTSVNSHIDLYQRLLAY
jgi:glycosyltransferase involved in cell wall biosynthesis